MNAANFVVASDGFQGYVLFDGSVPALIGVSDLELA